MKSTTYIALVRPEMFDEDSGELDLECYYCISETVDDMKVALREIRPHGWIMVEFESYLSLDGLAEKADDEPGKTSIYGARDITDQWR